MENSNLIKLPRCSHCGRVSKITTCCNACIRFLRVLKEQQNRFQTAISCLSNPSQVTVFKNYKEIRKLIPMLSFLDDCYRMLRSSPSHQREILLIRSAFQTLTP